MKKSDSIYIAGHTGLVGSSILNKLKADGYSNLILKSSSELDLRSQLSVDAFFSRYKPKYVFVAAAKVGGIKANSTYPAEFIYDNIMIQSNIIHSSYIHKAHKLLFLGSSCIYPKYAPQPIKESDLLTGLLEPTNESYAIAKIAGVKMCEAYRNQYGCNFISVMPTNLYGVNDNFDKETSHVIPGIISKFLEAKRTGEREVKLWGNGQALRDFLHVDDLTEACLLLMNSDFKHTLVNVGSGKEISIKELALLIRELMNMDCKILWDEDMPNGTPRKLMDHTLITEYGWKPEVDLKRGIIKVIKALSLEDEI